MKLLRSKLFRVVAIVVVLVAVAAILARMEIGRDWSRLNVAIASGSVEGRYHAVVDELAAIGAFHGATIRNVTTNGSADNVARLLESAAGKCDVAFALVQDGQAWPKHGPLELVGRLPRAESLLLLGKRGDDVVDFASLQNMTIGTGPEGSGSAEVVDALFARPDLAQLHVTVTHAPVAQQIERAAKGELDLAALVIDEDAPLIARAIKEQGLQIASLAHAEVIVGRVAGVHVGRIAAGHYDAVALSPSTDKTVLQVDTLVVGNGCASRSRTTALLEILARAFPDFVRANQHAASVAGLPSAAAATTFFEGGPDAFDEYAPWLVDVMPPGKWVYLITAISVLFNVMGFGNRFQLWRIDSVRVDLEREITRELGKTTTLGDIDRMQNVDPLRQTAVVTTCERVIHDLEALAERSRKMSLSILVPMGQEMQYRYQEDIIHETLAVLRGFLARIRNSR